MSETDGAAIQRVLAGDGDGFQTLVERYSHALFRLAYRMTGNEADADDVVQETFMRAYRSLANYDGRAAFTTWLYRIAANYPLDRLSASKRRAEILHPLDQKPEGDDDTRAWQPASTDPGPDRLLLSTEIQARLAAAMEDLTPQERTAFTLRHFEDLSIDEIGAALQLGSNATRNSIFRAVQKLRRNLAAWATSPGTSTGAAS